MFNHKHNFIFYCWVYLKIQVSVSEKEFWSKIQRKHNTQSSAHVKDEMKIYLQFCFL
jgi:hypothetical protein